jgi:hypothetical protein
MLVPFPHLCWQLFGVPSTISSTDQKVTLNEGFRNAHKDMVNFLKDKKINITTYSGGASKKAKTLSFIDSVMQKQKRKERGMNYKNCSCGTKNSKKYNANSKKRQPSSSKTRKSCQSAKVNSK